MYLVDTNLILELLLDQDNAEDVSLFLYKIDTSMLHITEFSVYSMGIILLRLKKADIFRQLIKDILDSGIRIDRLEPIDYELLVKNALQFSLDFDDAYQYTVAEKYNLQIVSFDSDFDKTKRGRKEPSNV